MIDFDELNEEDINFDYCIRWRFGPNIRHVTNFFNNREHIYIKAIEEAGMQNDLFIDQAFYIQNYKLSELPNHYKGLYAKNFKHLDNFWKIFDKLKNNYE